MSVVEGICHAGFTSKDYRFRGITTYDFYPKAGLIQADYLTGLIAHLGRDNVERALASQTRFRFHGFAPSLEQLTENNWFTLRGRPEEFFHEDGRPFKDIPFPHFTAAYQPQMSEGRPHATDYVSRLHAQSAINQLFGQLSQDEKREIEKAYRDHFGPMENADISSLEYFGVDILSNSDVFQWPFWRHYYYWIIPNFRIIRDRLDDLLEANVDREFWDEPSIVNLHGNRFKHGLMHRHKSIEGGKGKRYYKLF